MQIEEIPILHEESSFLVVNKPAGLLTQAVPGVESIATRMLKQLAARSDSTSKPFVGLPHRLDRGTSGALLIARNERSLKRFCGQFQSSKIDKIYFAMIENAPEPASGRWVDYLRKIPDEAKAELVDPKALDAREATLNYEIVGKTGHGYLVRIKLETGRMHQIRIQFASRGFPIFGDKMYGSCRSLGASDLGLFHEQFALHAWELGFHHPLNAKKMTIRAPLPDVWNTFSIPQQLIQNYSEEP